MTIQFQIHIRGRHHPDSFEVEVLDTKWKDAGELRARIQEAIDAGKISPAIKHVACPSEESINTKLSSE